MTLEEAGPRDGAFSSVLAGNVLVPAQVKDERMRPPRARIPVHRIPGKREGIGPHGDWKVKAVENLGPSAKVHRFSLSCFSIILTWPFSPCSPHTPVTQLDSS